MSEKVKQFILELSKDPVKMEEFWKDPDVFLGSADLTAEEKDILRSRDSEQIQKLLGPMQWHPFITTHHPPPHHGTDTDKPREPQK